MYDVVVDFVIGMLCPLAKCISSAKDNAIKQILVESVITNVAWAFKFLAAKFWVWSTRPSPIYLYLTLPDETDYIGLYLTLQGKAGYAMHGLKESSCHIKYNYFVFHYRFIINRIRAPKALHRPGKYHLHNGYVWYGTKATG